MIPSTFYAPSHRGNRFGVHGASYGPSGHRGQDFNGWAHGTLIPAWAPGVVDLSDWSHELGWMLDVVRADGLHVGYCHLAAQSSYPVGARIGLGTLIAPLGRTGSAALGDHLHTTASWADRNPATAHVVDPLPLILASIGSLAPAGGKSIPITEPKDDDMRLYYCKDSGGDLWTLIDFTSCTGVQTRSQLDANALSHSVNAGSIMGTPQETANAIALAERLTGKKFTLV